MIDQLEAWDKALFKVLNGAHNDLLDFLMPWISDKYIWIPLYTFILYGLIRYTQLPWWQIILSIIVLITISDQLASGLLKPWVGRLRPCYDPSLDGTVHLLKGCGGRFGFASSHASNSFAVAFFTWFLLKSEFRWTKWLLLWAAIVAYSRIYLGVHFPGDVIMGALIGWFSAFSVQSILLYFNKKKHS
jgi:undecaprenyl-diphosphatase